MVKRGMVILMGCILLIGLAAQTTLADEPPGAKLYATYCAGCHGASGAGGFAPAIGVESYLKTHDDAVIAQITGDGVPNNGMPTWSKSKGGSLTDDQIDSIVAYLRSGGSTVASAPTPAPTTEATTAVIEYAQTKMSVTQSTNANGDVVVSALLQKNDGTLVSGAVIAFERITTFGVIDLGTAKTDKSGTALLVLGDVPEAAREVNVNFKGDKSLGSSTGKIILQPPAVASSSEIPNIKGVRLSVGDEPLLPPEGSLITPNPPLLPSVLFLSVVGCIWAMYAFVISQVVGIWKKGRTAPRENMFSRKAR